MASLFIVTKHLLTLVKLSRTVTIFALFRSLFTHLFSIVYPWIFRASPFGKTLGLKMVRIGWAKYETLCIVLYIPGIAYSRYNLIYFNRSSFNALQIKKHPSDVDHVIVQSIYHKLTLFTQRKPNINL